MIASNPCCAAEVSASIPAPEASPVATHHLGSSRSPAGETITIDQTSLCLNGRRWLPAMGEFHYTRYPESEWRQELLKMKAGGIDIVGSYVFWIHHEEVNDRWDWSGRRDLRTFVKLAADAGLKVVVRSGPWCHGEVRNGGLPDWLVRSGIRLRSQDPEFLGPVAAFYGQIGQQLHGLLWKDGGPVIGIQLDNEYQGPAEYLLALKRLAREAGLDVPLYTRTGWPQLTTPMPFGEIIPLYGVYAEGFWDRELTSMPGRYWNGFRFSRLRVDDNIANEQLGRRGVEDSPDVGLYPYLTCEVGGGMMTSYHRRIRIDPADVESTVLVKLGSGSTLPGYYMYHGGGNPDGALTTLMEAQATPSTNWNDLPVKTYDFQAPLGQFGELRPQYHWLRRLHLFLADFGPELAAMPATMPDVRPHGRDDVTTLRWAVRSDGERGYVFVNNHERGRTLPAKPDIQFTLRLPNRAITFPDRPVTIPSGASFFWPFDFDLGHGRSLRYATAQPIAAIDDGAVRTVFFGETPGVPAQLHVDGEAEARVVPPGRGVAFTLAGENRSEVRIVVLSDADSLRFWKLSWRGRDRAFLSSAGLVVDRGVLRLTATEPAGLAAAVYPGIGRRGAVDGVFRRLEISRPRAGTDRVTVELLRAAGRPREIPLGKITEPVAMGPTDADFAAAAVWRIRLPRNLDLANDPLLRIRYAGDVARLTLDGKLLNDNFYNGRVFDLGLKRYAPEILKGDLQIEILPLSRDVVEGPRQRIFVDPDSVPAFDANGVALKLQAIEIVPRYEATCSGAHESSRV